MTPSAGRLRAKEPHFRIVSSPVGMVMFSAQKGHRTFSPVDHLSLAIMMAQAVTSQADISIKSWVAFLWVVFRGQR